MTPMLICVSIIHKGKAIDGEAGRHTIGVPNRYSVVQRPMLAHAQTLLVLQSPTVSPNTIALFRGLLFGILFQCPSVHLTFSGAKPVGVCP